LFTEPSFHFNKRNLQIELSFNPKWNCSIPYTTSPFLLYRNKTQHSWCCSCFAI